MTNLESSPMTEMPLLADKSHLIEGDKVSLRKSTSSRNLNEASEQQGLFSVKAIIVLIVWYITSFIVIILNKWTLDVMKGDPILLSSIQMVVIAVISVFQLYTSCGMYKNERRKAPYPPSFFKQMLFVGAVRFLSLLLGIISLKYVAVSFTETIKCSAPVFTVLISFILVGEKNGIYVFCSLLPIMLGLGLCSAYELSFNLIGFIASLATNITECAQFVYSKLYICGDKSRINPAEFQLFTSVASVIFEIPVCIFLVQPSAYAHALEWDMLWATVVNALFYYVQTITSFVLMIYISPVTHSVSNTVKRALMIWASVLVFGNPVTLLSGVGTFVVFSGVLLYNRARAYEQTLRAVGGPPLPVTVVRNVDL